MGRHTPAQFDMLVDHLLREGTDYDMIGGTFVTLASLYGSKVVVWCMSQDTSIYARHAAMGAAVLPP